MKRFLSYVLLIAAAASCGRLQSDGGILSEDSIVQFFTKSSGEGSGGGSNKVFRIYLNGPDEYDTKGIEVSGTYCDTGGDTLIPCSIDSNLEMTGEDSSCGLRSIDGTYKMHIVYPAVTMTEIPEKYGGVSDGRTGYMITREPREGVEDIVLSNALMVKLNGVYLSDATDPNATSSYVFDAGDPFLLKQPRSKITVNFKCGDEVVSTILKSVDVTNLVKEGFFRPLEGVYYFNRQSHLESASLFPQEGDVPEGQSGVEVGKDSWKKLGSFRLLSMDYSELTPQGAPRWTIPSLIFTTADKNTGKQGSFTVSLAWNFEKQMEYIFNITMNSTNATLSVTVKDWDPVETGTEVGESYGWSATVSIDTWTNGSSSGGNINSQI